MMSQISNLMDVTQALAKARHNVLDKQNYLMVSEIALAEVQALAEVEIVEAAGGAKGLGANAEARKRMMTLGLAVHDDYQKALGERHRDWMNVERAKIEMRNAKDLLETLQLMVEWEA